MKRIITETMSYEEIDKLIAEDTPWLQYQILDLKKSYLEHLKRCKEKGVFIPKVFKLERSNRGIDYNVVIYNETKNDFLQGPIYIAYAVIPRKEGLAAIVRYRLQLAVGNTHINTGSYTFVFWSHYFDRYRERVLKDNTISKSETIKTFFIQNKMMAYQRQENKRYQNGVYVCFDNAFALGVIENGMIILRTCVSRDGIFENQEMAKSLFDIYHEEIWKNV